MRPLGAIFLNSIMLALPQADSSTKSTQSNGVPELGVGLLIKSPACMWLVYSSGRQGMLAVMTSLHLLIEVW